MKKSAWFSLLFSLIAITAARAQVTFSAAMPIDTPFSYNTQWAGFGDLDGDSDLDLVFKGSNTNFALSWMGQNDQHQLVNKQPLVTGKNIKKVLVADLDNANGPDILYSHADGIYHLTWLKNTGAGLFEQQGDLLTATYTEVLEDFFSLIDFDADGDLDVLVSKNSGNTTRALLLSNTGNGVFASPAELYAGPLNVHFEAADLTGDGHCDLTQETITYGANLATSKVELIKNNGANQFSLSVLLAPSLVTGKIQLTDFTHDDVPDVMGLDGSGTWGGNLVLIKNSGAGVFGAPVVVQQGDYYNILVGDLDNDGDKDLMTQFGAANYQMICHAFINDGDGNMGAPVEVHTLFPPMLEACDFSALQDWDADGKLDFLLQGFSLYYKLNADGFQFEPRKRALQIKKPDMAYCNVNDFNNDGHLDLMGGGGRATAVTGYYLNEGNNSFEQQEPPFTDSCTTYNYVADLNGDGALDLLRTQPERLVWFENDGAGHFGPATLLMNLINIDRIRPADLDHDGDTDLTVFIKTDTAGVSTASLVVLRNDGAGNFPVVQNQLLCQFIIRRSMLMDINADGFLDIVYAHTGNKIEACLNDGNGTFLANQVLYSPQSGNCYLVPGDFDQDGDEDILYCDYIVMNKIVLMRNDGQGGFGTVNTQSMNLATLDVYVIKAVDLDYDGKLDLLFKGVKTVYWLKNNGNGVFAAPQLLITGLTEYFGATFIDMDNDNDVDVVTNQGGTVFLGWFENNTTVGTHQPQFGGQQLTVAPNPAATCTEITLPDAGNLHTVFVFGVNGALVMQEDVRAATYHLERHNLPAGPCFIWVTDKATGRVVGSGEVIWQ